MNLLWSSKEKDPLFHASSFWDICVAYGEYMIGRGTYSLYCHSLSRRKTFYIADLVLKVSVSIVGHTLFLLF